MEDDLLYQLALSKVSGIGPAFARKLIRHFGKAQPVFSARQAELDSICGCVRAEAVKNFNGFHEVEKEISFLERYSIRPLYIEDKDYPRRLLDCKDMPLHLFYKGSADLNVSRVITVVGTRNPTQYGKQVTERLVRDLASAAPGLLIVSGLAYGIDAIAHQAALDNKLPTIGVLGHGLDRIYPQQNAPLAKKMISQGGLLTKFNINTTPNAHNFPDRNRIVAGMSDALIVVETDVRGGSMLTVMEAIRHQKKVFAFPGRITDNRSAGCNALIGSGKARLLFNTGQLLQDLKWESPASQRTFRQTTLFSGDESAMIDASGRVDTSGLSKPEKNILQQIRERSRISVDELYSAAINTPYRSELTMILLNLELNGLIDALPGKIYRLRE